MTRSQFATYLSWGERGWFNLLRRTYGRHKAKKMATIVYATLMALPTDAIRETDIRWVIRYAANQAE